MQYHTKELSEYPRDDLMTAFQASEVSKQSRSSRLTKHRSRSQSPEDMARLLKYSPESTIQQGVLSTFILEISYKNTGYARQSFIFLLDYRTIVFRRPSTPEITPSRYLAFDLKPVVDLLFFFKQCKVHTKISPRRILTQTFVTRTHLMLNPEYFKVDAPPRQYPDARYPH